MECTSVKVHDDKFAWLGLYIGRAGCARLQEPVRPNLCGSNIRDTRRSADFPTEYLRVLTEALDPLEPCFPFAAHFAGVEVDNPLAFGR